MDSKLTQLVAFRPLLARAVDKMKRTIVDRIIGFISPAAELRRVRSQRAVEIIRSYDSASNFNSGDWVPSRGTSAVTEIRQGHYITRDRSRDLVRNAPYANKAINVIVSNTVGPGIVPKIKGRTDTQTKKITQAWKAWGETTACDFNRQHNFYGLQALALRATVEGGEVLARKSFKSDGAKLQLLETDYLNRQYSNSIDNIEGLWIDKGGNVVAYEMFERHPGDFRSYNATSNKIPADQIIHMFKVERAGQMRGISWFYPVATAMKDFADFQNATLIRQKVAACYTAFITDNDTNATVDPEVLRAQREADNSLEPATMKYLLPGQGVQFANPPGVDQYDAFARQSLRSIAAGLGISAESMTGDYSQVNFSSGRMGHLEFQRNIDMWRWQMLIPGFCDPAWDHFLNHCAIQGMDIQGVTVDWTCPAREMIDPTKEIASLKDEVRSGFKSLPEAIRERGLDPDLVLEEIAESNAKLDELKIVLDTDPRQITAQGMMQMISEPADPQDPNAGNGEDGKAPKENAPKPPGKSGTKQSKRTR